MVNIRSKRQPTTKQTTEATIQRLYQELGVVHKILEDHFMKHHGLKPEEVKQFYVDALSPPKPEKLLTEPVNVEGTVVVDEGKKEENVEAK